MEGVWKDDKPSGIYKYTRFCYDVYGTIDETRIKGRNTATELHEAWGKTENMIILVADTENSTYHYKVIPKDELFSMYDNYHEFEIETVGKVKFRKCIHWTGDNGPFAECVDGPVYSFSSCNTCPEHGEWNFASMIPAFNPYTADYQDVDEECSCRSKDEMKIVENGQVFSRPLPVILPKVKKCRGGKSMLKVKEFQHVKDTKVRCISKRDMGMDVDNVSNDLDEILDEGGWSLTSTKKHIKYSRDVGGKKQHFICPKTPSDVRSRKNNLATIRNVSRKV